MRNKILFILLLFVARQSIAQFNNEWIDYSKTYYKFKIAATGLYRINQSNLPAALSSVPAEHFQLWRNGEQVPLYTSVASGSLGSGGYIEFWGEKNDGVPDRPLYRNPNHQLSQKLSLESDTAVFFLTVNTNDAQNLRYTNAINDITNPNNLPPLQYFMHTVDVHFKEMINRGMALVAGEYVYSSAYDEGEWWSSNEIVQGSTKNISFNNLNVFTGATANASFKMSVAGTAPTGSRQVKAMLGSTPVIDTVINNGVNNFGFVATIINRHEGNNVPVSAISSGNANFVVSSTSGNSNDRIVVGFAELKYPHNMNLGNASSFEFSLPATSNGYLLEFDQFNISGANPPVLYDRTNNLRYIGSVTGTKVKFVLPSGAARSLVLVNTSVTTSVTQFTQKQFINYATLAGDYLIISNPALGLTSGGAVHQYWEFRRSTLGGSFNAQIYDIEELTDQFAFGIRKHPLSVKNFIRWSRFNFPTPPKFAFIIGRGVTYNESTPNEGKPELERLNLVPTFGYPASDILLAADAHEPIMAVPIGRLSAISQQEVLNYLGKITQYAEAQNNPNQTIANKEWMKNVVHIAGANSPSLDQTLQQFLNTYGNIIKDTFYGGNLINFFKTTSGTATTISEAEFSSVIQRGVGLLTYYGHGSATTLDYNLPEVTTWNNTGKYPMFLMLGCNVGNSFNYDVGRLTTIPTLSELYLLTAQEGGIGMVASTHFGFVDRLHAYASQFYTATGKTQYNKSVTAAMNEANQAIMNATNDFLARIHAEQHILSGDPAIKINSFPKPDFVIEEPQVSITPTFISVADTSFNVKAYFYNIGKATGDSVSVEVRRQYPDGSLAVVFTKKIKPAVKYVDSISFNLPILPTRDKGQNNLTITIDNDFKFDELSESNNSIGKSFYIYEDEVRPIYPYNFAIINRNNAKLYASSANPLALSTTYTMEIDTTEFFSSSFKKTKTVTSVGGVLEFDPGFTYTDSTVYYWRVGIQSSAGMIWNTASFTYLPGTNVGYNQSHFYQHTRSSTERMFIDSADRKWKFSNRTNNIFIKHGIYPTSALSPAQQNVAIDGDAYLRGTCTGSAIVFNVIDPITFKPYYNQSIPATYLNGSQQGGFMGSGPVCNPDAQWNFTFSYLDSANRKKAADFMNWVPQGSIVVVRLWLDAQPVGGFDGNPFVDKWQSEDVPLYGLNNSLYGKLKAAGFIDLDSYTYPRTWAFVYKQNVPSFTPQWRLSAGLYDMIDGFSVNFVAPDSTGTITSPKFGPAVAWKEVQWRGSSLENPTQDQYTVDVIGVKNDGSETTLFTLNPNQQNFNISSISASQYPYVRLKMNSKDGKDLTPYQLRYWRLFYTPVPEGGLAPNLKLTFKDTLEVGEPLVISIPFKNVSDANFANTIKVNIVITDNNNQQTVIPATRLKALTPGDTAMVAYEINTQQFTGVNIFYVDVNPNEDQPEQTHFNNFMYKTFFVKPDAFNPFMDVTFDGVHILNNDIVSAKPVINIKLKDESKYLMLNDTSLITISLKYPDGSVHRFRYGTDTLKFNPATPGGDNVASSDFSPSLLEDGAYELIVRGKDKSGNAAGSLEYRVSFQVYNKPMISNMFNYPNPFTTSTAFVFTVTGSQVPQNIKIQIMTVTGKIVREITKDELGPIHIGRNITEFKWDGTDQYGQKLANGVYLYRVATNLNGNSLEKFPTMDAFGENVNTDKYFNKGYGKMYLMH